MTSCLEEGQACHQWLTWSALRALRALQGALRALRREGTLDFPPFPAPRVAHRFAED